MAKEWEEQLKEWKGKLPFYKRIFYTIAGYPPKHFELDERNWSDWKKRFEKDEYNWENHSGVENNEKLK